MLFTLKLGKVTSIEFTSEADIKEVFGADAEVVSLELELPTNLDEGIHMVIVIKNPDLAKIAETGNLLISQMKDQGLYDN